ncbi:cytochrome P450 [Amycolatopsis nigrescens]|uniref:cytochrome P450 n=1 Tax=Amycolatopsis nigrescens TaxID=381445 RepID=UPI00037CE554|nr:cytochrome P450 [Amycolatopsis nigrescens]
MSLPDSAPRLADLATGSGEPPASASVPDTLRIAGKALLPTIAGGVIKRRPPVLSVAQKLQLDQPSIPLFQRLRRQYGPGPLVLRVPGRSIAVPLSGADAGRLLADSPEPFTPASLEKRAALSHFQPHGVLISAGGERAKRRAFNEAVLETERPMHEVAAKAAAVVEEEAEGLPGGDGRLDWNAFDAAWWRVVRRIVLGDGARADTELIARLNRLRLAANWAYLGPRLGRLRERFDERLRAHLDRAEPGSLAQVLASTPAEPEVDPAGQVPHWLFAFDAAGMVTARTLALLATHADQLARVREELAQADPGVAHPLPYLRACVLDAVRLWPTTPVLLRESTVDTQWGTGELRAGTTFLIFTPFFHRDRETLPYADRFAPDVWLDGQAACKPALAPFSGGPGACPGRNLVLMTTTAMLAALIRRHDYALISAPDLDPNRPLPATIDNFGLEFEAR